MSTKSCPFCGKDISDEAIICKFCHRLLIDENGKDISSDDAEPVPETPAEDKTIVYSKDELKKALDEAAGKNIAEEYYEDDEYQSESYDDQEYSEQYAGEQEYDDYGDGYDEGEYTYDENSEVYADDDYEEEYDEQPRYRSAARDGAADIPTVDYDPKRTFIITIIVTLGILLIIIAAIVVGYKLFGFDDEETSQPQITTPAPTETLPPETQPVETEYVPQVTDDTISESPEETSNSGLADPVVTSDSMVVVPGDSAADSSADSASDSSADSAADESQQADESAAETTETDIANDGPEGSFYTWDEAFGIIETYFATNGMNGTYAYAYGEENTSMTFQYYDEEGNPAGLYTVDLYTGQVTAS